MTSSADEYMSALDHSRKDEVEALRRVIVDACPELVEHVKWNAPSYQIDGDDRITMRLKPGWACSLLTDRSGIPMTSSAER